VAATHASFESVDFLPIWERLDDHAVLVHGTDSAVVTGAGLASLRARNHRPVVVPIDRAGHMVFWDRPEASVTALRDQLVRLLGPRQTGVSAECPGPG
jgi:N-formylmaleamate deformylase